MEVINLFITTTDKIWYSIILNGTKNDSFYTVTQGFKQGGPLFLFLFITDVGVLARLINKLIHNKHFLSFFMPNKGPVINHLSLADDIDIFTNGSTLILFYKL